MSFTVNKNTKTGAKPQMKQQLLGINDQCLILQDGVVSYNIITAWVGASLFWVIGLPMFIFMAIAPWLPPYGYRDGIAITNFYDKISGLHIIAIMENILIFAILVGGFGFMMSLFLLHLHLRFLKKSSPVIFNRQKQTYSIFVDGELLETPWRNISGGTETHRHFSGSFITSIGRLILRTSGKTKISVDPTDGLYMDSDEGESHTGIEAAWEYIRHFMENGPDKLDMLAKAPLGIVNLDKQPMYSYNFKQSLKSCSVRGIFPENPEHPAENVFAFIKFLIKTVFFIPNLLADWLLHKSCLNRLKNSKCTPQYSFELCGNDTVITPADAEKVITKEEAEKGDMISYSEAKRRLKASNTL